MGLFDLREVLKAHPEYIGTHASTVAGGRFPILIKLIDANKDLSVQVHPDDEYSLKNEAQLGKTEFWYVLDSKKDSSLVYGFNRDVEADEVRKAIDDDTIGNLLNHVPVKKNDLFFIESGTVHAIGAGCLVAEIQENSNVTYRLYDYDRVDKNGKQRELNIDKGLEVAKLKASAAPRQPMRVLRYRNGCASELLCRCRASSCAAASISRSRDSFLILKLTGNSRHLRRRRIPSMRFFVSTAAV